MKTRAWSRWQSIAETLALLVMAAAVAWIALVKPAASPVARPAVKAPRPEPPLPTDPVALADAETVGSRTAEVALVVYSDFQCPFCAKFARETLPDLKQRYVSTGQVLLAFRHFPLPNHPFAEKAAEAAVCAGRQSKFWVFHDDLFANQQALDIASLEARAARLGLKTPEFSACLDGQTTALVQADRSAGRPLGITGTPTFLAGPLLRDGRMKVTRRFSGAQPLAEFQRILDQLVGTSAVAVVPGSQ